MVMVSWWNQHSSVNLCQLDILLRPVITVLVTACIELGAGQIGG